MLRSIRAILIQSVASIAVLGTATASAAVPPPLPIEKTGIVKSLPKQYPADWFFVHEAGFFNMSDGKVYVIDTEGDTVGQQVKGSFNISYIGNIAQSPRRGEIYATETFHSRGTRGERIDVLTIWDHENLTPVAEVMLPSGKRFMGIPQRNAAMIVINEDRWLAIANFSPATSITLIDLDKREIINEVPTPGCSLVYPTGKRGFSSLCADGRFMSTSLKANGQIEKQVRTEVFFSSDDSPIYERMAKVGSTTYFPTLSGQVHPVDMSGDVAVVQKAWDLRQSDAEREANWAPGGIGIIDQDGQGRIYVLMHEGAHDGSYQGGGSEVWILDPKTGKRIGRVVLKEWGLSLAVTQRAEPKLMVVNPVDMSLEMYDPDSGKFIKKITDFGNVTPLMVHGTK